MEWILEPMVDKMNQINLIDPQTTALPLTNLTIHKILKNLKRVEASRTSRNITIMNRKKRVKKDSS